MKRNLYGYVLVGVLVIFICVAMIINPEIWGYLIQRMLATPVYIVP